MRIFKFGGASVKDADGIKNVFSVLDNAQLGLTVSPAIEWCIPL
jgi:aspartokinase